MREWEWKNLELVRKQIWKAKGMMGEWLNQWKWTLFFTGTVKDYATGNCLYYRYLRFLNHIQEREKVGVGSFWGLEKFKNGANYHIHSLIYIDWKGQNMFVPRIDYYWKWWFEKWGRNRIEFYNENLGAGWYVAKYITKGENNDYGVWGKWRKK